MWYTKELNQIFNELGVDLNYGLQQREKEYFKSVYRKKENMRSEISRKLMVCRACVFAVFRKPRMEEQQ